MTAFPDLHIDGHAPRRSTAPRLVQEWTITGTHQRRAHGLARRPAAGPRTTAPSSRRSTTDGGDDRGRRVLEPAGACSRQLGLRIPDSEPAPCARAAAPGADGRLVCSIAPMLRVLLTNDDGIDAEGLQALRRALRRARRHRARGDRARRQPLGDRALDHHPPPAVGRARCRSTTARVGYASDGTPVDCVRLAALGLIEGFEPDADRLGHQPRRQPRRRHHLLRHGRRGAGGRRARHPGHRRLPAVARAREMDFRLGDAVRLRRPRPRSPRASSTGSTTCRCPAGTLLNVNVPGGRHRAASRSRGSASASTATSSS